MQKHLLLWLGLLLAAAGPVLAQSNQFRGTRAHLGAGLGVFTYYGPIDLKLAESGSNYIRKSDPAVVLLGSFPIIGDRFYFRGIVGVTNFDTDNERRLLSNRSSNTYAAQNEFLAHELFFFEPEVVWTLLPGSRSRFLPYLYTGFGGLLADPFGRRDNNVNRPGTGVPGPERSVFAFPIGAGVDVAISRYFSFFIDASYRFNFNYVARNEVNGVNPHNTSLVMGGIRIGIFGRRTEQIERAPLPVPEPIDIPAYQPPPPIEIAPVRVCPLVDLNTVFFAINSDELDAEARRLLDENIQALRLNPECCIEIVGYTDQEGGSPANALRISRQRAEVVYNYYLAGGIARERMRTRAEGVVRVAMTSKKDDTSMLRRVETLPFDCQDFLDLINNR